MMWLSLIFDYSALWFMVKESWQSCLFLMYYYSINTITVEADNMMQGNKKGYDVSLLSSLFSFNRPNVTSFCHDVRFAVWL